VASPAGCLRDELEKAGAELVEVPLPLTAVARAVIGALPLSGCLLRTSEEVDAFSAERESWSGETVGWCLSPDTARRAVEIGWNPAVEVSGDGSGAALIAAVKERRFVGTVR
jgi:uroporphyrinogen-III synthase